MKKLYLSIIFALIAMFSAKADVAVTFDFTGCNWGDLSTATMEIVTPNAGNGWDWNTRHTMTRISGNCFTYTILGTISTLQFNFFVNGQQKSQGFPYTPNITDGGSYSYEYNGSWIECPNCCGGVVTPVPSVVLTAPAMVYDDETIVFSAVAQNFENPIYTVTVLKPSGYADIGVSSPYTLSEGAGNYLIQVDVAESSAPAVSLAQDSKTVEVRHRLAPGEGITVKWRLAEGTSVPNMHIHAWQTGGGNLCGNWPGEAVTIDGEGWYSRTFSETELPVNVIFNNGGAPQTPNLENITSDVCYEVSQNGNALAAAVLECVIVNLPKPDLIVEEITYTWDPHTTECPQRNDFITFTAKVKNIGEEPSPAGFNVDFYANSVMDAVGTGTYSQSVGVGETVEITATQTWQCPSGNSQAISACVAAQFSQQTNNDCLNNFSIATNGSCASALNEISISDKIYTANGKIYVSDNSTTISAVYNILGKEMINENLPQGVYLVKINSFGKISAGKIIVR
ncbi:MAG: starch-binding protein [Prevotellaceae bacterium]|jgi:hypothetical protein|nr:starch-binding protein [Prevotellaceae bacterium]